MFSNEFNFFCENDTLKKILAYNEISPTFSGRNAIAKTLSTLIDEYVVLYGKNLDVDLLKKYSRSNNYDILVQVIVNIPSHAPVKIIDNLGVLRDGLTSDFSNNDIALMINWSIPFSNFLSIKGINGQIPFSVIDENFNVPYELVVDCKYISNSNISIEVLGQAFSKIDSNISFETDDEMSFSIDELTKVKSSSKKKVSKKNIIISNDSKIGCSLLMALHTCKELDKQKNITANIYYLLENKIDFGSYIKKEFYNWIDEDVKSKMSKVDDIVIKYKDSLKKVSKIKNDKKKSFDNLLDIVMYHFLNCQCEKYNELNFDVLLNSINDDLTSLENFDLNQYADIMHDKNSRDVMQKLNLTIDEKILSILYFFKMFHNNNIMQITNTIEAFNISKDVMIIINALYGLLYGMYLVPKEYKTDVKLNNVVNSISKKIASVKDYSISNDIVESIKYLKCGYPMDYINILLENTYVNKHKTDLSETINVLTEYKNLFVVDFSTQIKFNDFTALLKKLNDNSKKSTKDVLNEKETIHKAYNLIINKNKTNKNKKNKQLSLFEGE